MHLILYNLSVTPKRYPIDGGLCALLWRPLKEVAAEPAAMSHGGINGFLESPTESPSSTSAGGVTMQTVR